MHIGVYHVKQCKKKGAVKKHISSSEEAEITVRSMVFFASLCWRRCKWTACFCPIHTAFLEGARGNRSLAYKEWFPRKYLVFVFSQPLKNAATPNTARSVFNARRSPSVLIPCLKTVPRPS